jgi:hypothetical protein
MRSTERRLSALQRSGSGISPVRPRSRLGSAPGRAGSLEAGSPQPQPSVGLTPYVGAVVYVLLVHYSYVAYLAVTFDYLGFSSRPVDMAIYGLTVALAAALVAALPKQLKRPSDFMLWACYALVVAPTMTAVHYSTFLHTEEIPGFVLAVSVCFIFIATLTRGGPKFSLVVKADPPLGAYALILISMATYGYLFLTAGLQVRFVALADVQELRLAYREQAKSGIVGYLIPAQAYVVNPTVIAWGIYRRRGSMIVLGVFGQLLLYSVGGHRMAILSPIAILALVLVFRKRSLVHGRMLLYGPVVLIALHLALARMDVLGEVGLMIQRLIVFPAVLASATVEFFSHHEKAYWAHSFMSPFIEYPYNYTPNFLIGAWLGNPNNSVNVNFLADGYSNLGYTGMAIEAAVFVLSLWLLDATLDGLPMPIACSMLILPAIALANISAFTVILSQGVGVAMILGAVLPRTGWRGSDELTNPERAARGSTGARLVHNRQG